MKLIEIEAPMIDGSYPSAPNMRSAWNAAWTLMEQANGPMQIKALAHVVKALVPDVTTKTVYGLVNKAHREGLLDRELIGRDVTYQIKAVHRG